MNPCSPVIGGCDCDGVEMVMNIPNKSLVVQRSNVTDVDHELAAASIVEATQTHDAVRLTVAWTGVTDPLFPAVLRKYALCDVTTQECATFAFCAASSHDCDQKHRTDAASAYGIDCVRYAA
jgi:hypothetical protein